MTLNFRCIQMLKRGDIPAGSHYYPWVLALGREQKGDRFIVHVSGDICFYKFGWLIEKVVVDR